MSRIKIVIANLFLKDIPKRQSRVFLKLKAGKDSTTTKKQEISDQNIVEFSDPIILEYKQKYNLRFSFRLEMSDGIKFSRYGICKIPYKAQRDSLHYEMKLKHCNEMPKMECDILLYSSSLINSLRNQSANLQPNNERSISVSMTKTLSLSDKKVNFPPMGNSSSSTTNKINKSYSVNTQPLPKLSDLSISSSINSFKTINTEPPPKISSIIPHKLTQERYLELETKIDELLASIINEEDDHVDNKHDNLNNNNFENDQSISIKNKTK